MKKKSTPIILSAVLGITVFGLCTACGGASNPSGTTTPPAQEVQLPTKAQIVSARQNAVNETVQGYDFDLSFSGNFSVLGLGTSLGGKYAGAYRYDGATDEVQFKRTTSGALLFDSTAYVFTSGDSRIKLTMDGAEVKKLSVEVPEEQSITMVNLPIVALVDSVKEANIKSVTALKNSAYAYSCPLALDSSNPVFGVLNTAFEKLGTGVSFKDIGVKANSSTLDFNIKDDKINDFRLAFQMEIDVKAVKVGINVEYKQNAASSTIVIPNSVNSFIYKSADVNKEVEAINATIADLKNDPVYSLDITAKNEFDPGWNKTAITDSYIARMYKNTDADENIWFNHSYCYKAHSEKDGKESYKYTLGNVNSKDEDNQGTWLISRKSSNTQTKVENVSADTQFDFLTSMIKLNSAEIDCIKKQTKDTDTIYTLYLGRMGTTAVQQKIIDMINTNKYGDVIAVDNYFNTDNIVKDAVIEIVLTDGKINSVNCKTKLCYTPIGGDYTEYNITLDNTIELLANKNYAKAAKYEAPTKVKGTLNIGNNLNDTNNYIL